MIKIPDPMISTFENDDITITMRLDKGKEQYVTITKDIETQDYHNRKKIETKVIITPREKAITERIFEVLKDGEYYATLKVPISFLDCKEWRQAVISRAVTTYPTLKRYTRSKLEITNPIPF